MYFHTPDWELAIFRWLNDSIRNPLFDTIMPVLSAPEFLWILALVGGLLMARRQSSFLVAALSLGLTVGASDLSCSFIKETTQRMRPYHSLALTWLVGGDAWKQRPADFAGTNNSGSSYPSAHAANAVAATWMIFALHRRPVFWLVPFLIGISRVYLGKHFPMDVVAGWLVGAAAATVAQPLSSAFFNRIRSRWIKYRFRA